MALLFPADDPRLLLPPVEVNAWLFLVPPVIITPLYYCYELLLELYLVFLTGAATTFVPIVDLMAAAR